MNPADFVGKLRTALSTDQTHVRLPRHLLEAWIGWVDEAREAAREWLANVPEHPNEGSVDMYLGEAEVLIRRLAYLPEEEKKT